MATKKKAKRRAPKNKPQSQPSPMETVSQPLPEPEPLPQPVTEASTPEPEKPSGLFASLKNAFSQANPSPKSEDSSASSTSSSTSEPPISAETEAQLARVPDVVGDDPGELPDVEPAGQGSASSSPNAFELLTPDFVVMGMQFASGVKVFKTKNKAWAVTKEEAEPLAELTSSTVNQTYELVRPHLPEWLVRMIEEGSINLLLVMQWFQLWNMWRDFLETKTEAAAKWEREHPEVVGGAVSKPAPVEVPKKPAAKAVPDAPVGIPVASGMIGDAHAN